MTLDEGIAAIEELINSFPDEHFVELLEETIDRARTALDARREDERREDAGEL